MSQSTKYVYLFGDGKADGKKEMKALLGGKGANLGEMSSIGLPVPPGFTITTSCCQYYNEHGRSWPAELEQQVRDGIASLEGIMKAGFGNPENPLLVSVRSGAAISMPGMMEILKWPEQ